MGGQVSKILAGCAVKAANGTLLALFASDQPFEQFDLYTITLISGLVLRYANCPFDVVFGGNTWLCAKSAGGVVIDEAGDSGPRAHWTVGFNTGSWQVTVMPRSSDVIGSLPWLSAARAGILQEAIVRVDRGYVSAWPTTPALTLVPVGLVNVFFGRVAEIDFGRSSVQININDPRELLDIDMPRNVYSAQCRYALFSPQCTLNPASFASSVAVIGVTSTQIFRASLPAQVDNYFALGNLVFTSGQNNGLRMMIRSSLNASGTLSLIAPMPFNVAIGDTLTVYPGCDKSVATCTNKFSNVINYGGFTQIPAPEQAI
jgi:hypothetical protein